MHKLLFPPSPLPTPLVVSNENTAKDKGVWRNVVAGSYFDILKNVFLFFLSANEKWKKWNMFLYRFREKNYLTLYQFELLTP